MEFLKQGLYDKEARRRVFFLLGHNRDDVTYKYVPKGMGEANFLSDEIRYKTKK